ncbi:hypothetical protein FB556_1553 [Enteractinococcus coprophilus]|uniref:Uncharacterized protein n=1 Tax=Enteractinococcus coprophilus TaxID=1027633 RepID=A0A543AJW6_9MICC|nr:hypothetical protein FB556_1553 [Enteractinococcus coprophilus]
MTSFPNISPRSTHLPSSQQLLANFPVGGADPDFAIEGSTRPKICALPVVGKLLPQCR